MRLTHWLAGLARQRPGFRRFIRRKRNADTAQAVERLEDRTLLTVFTVNTTDDTIDTSPGDGIAADVNGNTSLRAAVMEANALVGQDMINLPAGTYTRTMAGFNEGHAGTGDLDIRSTISIVANGAGSTIIDADGMDRVFHVFSNGNLTLQGVTALGGDASENSLDNRAGGGIWNNGGTLTLIQSTVTNNTTPSTGGGIANTSNGRLTLTESTISHNVMQSSTFGGGGVFLGPLTDDASVTIDGGSIKGNTTSGSGGGIYAASMSDASEISISGVEIADNITAGQGGGIFLGEISGTSRVTISSTDIIGNSANDHAGGIRIGGVGYGSSVTVADSVISSNVISSGKDAGGVLVNSVYGTVTLIRNTISANSANGGGGIVTYGPFDVGHLLLAGNTISNNSASGSGGGVRATMVKGTFQFSGNVVSDNSSDNGGGLYLGDITSGSTWVDGNTFSTNASSGQAGGVYLGRIYTQTWFVNNTVSNNTATTNGAGVFVEYAPRTLTLANNTITGNDAGVDVGGLLSVSGSPIALHNTIVAGNNSSTGDVDLRGKFESRGNNLIGVIGETEGFTHGVNGDLVGFSVFPVDPLLGPLQHNGGDVLTHALQHGSPAIDAGHSTLGIGRSGSEFQINTYTDGVQDSSSIAQLSNGGFVVTWRSRPNGGTSYISGQRYDAEQTPVGAEFQVNDDTIYNHELPALTGLVDGGFVVTWTRFQNNSNWNIQGKRFNAEGNAVGGEFRVTNNPSGYQYTSAISRLNDGGFVVSWTSD